MAIDYPLNEGGSAISPSLLTAIDELRGSQLSATNVVFTRLAQRAVMVVCSKWEL